MTVIGLLLFPLSFAAVSPSSPPDAACAEHTTTELRLACLEALELPALPEVGSAAVAAGSADPAWLRVLRDRLQAATRAEDWDHAARAAWLLVQADDGSGRLDWVDRNGEPAWRAPIDAGSGDLGRAARLLRLAGRSDLAEPLLARALLLGQSIEADAGWEAETLARLAPRTGEILARTWFLPLPPLTLNVIGGEPIATTDLRGDVLVFDFWASWCAPCLEELPLMQAFHQENADRGLRTFAVNVGESREVAVSAAASLGLELPLVEYTDELASAFGVEQFPTVVLVDRVGELRGRWELFQDGTEERIFWAVEQILDLENTEGEAIARDVIGGETLEVRWMREFRGIVEAVLPVSRPGHDTRVHVCHGRTLLALTPEGRTERKLTGELTAGRLVPTRADDEGRYALLSYRLGGTAVSRFALPAGESETWEAPAPVFDAQWVDRENPAAGFVLATTKGLVQMDAEGRPQRSADIGLVRGLAAGSGSAPAADGWVALTGTTDTRVWQTLASDLALRTDRELEHAPWRLEGSGRGGRFGLLSPSIKAVAVGRFFDADREQVAAAGEGQLVILDTATGAEAFRAQWDGIQGLSAGDLDGDGIDELFVAWGRRIAVLSRSNQN